jgi:hypothetical protein
MKKHMTNLKLVFFVLMTLTISLVINSYYSKHAFSQSDYVNKTPEKIVELYWDASFRGDKEIVANVSALSAKEYLQNCSETNLADQSELIIDSSLEKIEPEDISPNITISSSKFQSISTEVSVTSTSDYIFATRISPSRIRLKDKIVFKDEAKVVIEQADYKSSFENPVSTIFFLEKNQSGWKIVASYIGEGIDWEQFDYVRKKTNCSEE